MQVVDPMILGQFWNFKGSFHKHSQVFDLQGKAGGFRPMMTDHTLAHLSRSTGKIWSKNYVTKNSKKAG